MPAETVDDLRVLLREMAWTTYTDARNYHEIKRALKQSGQWDTPRPGADQNKERASAPRGSGSGGGSKMMNPMMMANPMHDEEDSLRESLSPRHDMAR